MMRLRLNLGVQDLGYRFDIHPSTVCRYFSKWVDPPFTRGKPQLSKLEVDSSRQLSQVRIHVERVIGAVRQKYMILQSTLPISMVVCYGEDKLSPIDKIVTRSCALYNHCNSVVPFN